MELVAIGSYFWKSREAERLQLLSICAASEEPDLSACQFWKVNLLDAAIDKGILEHIAVSTQKSWQTHFFEIGGVLERFFKSVLRT